MAIDDDAQAIEMHRISEATVAKIKPLLAGLDLQVRGFILADLLAMHLAGFPPGLRKRMEALSLELVHDLIAINASNADKMRKPEGSA